MPSRHSPPPLPPTTTHHRFQTLPLIIAGSLTLTGVLLILITLFLYRRLYKNRTAPSDLIISNSKSPQHYQCRRFSYSQLRRATNSFSHSTQLGHGGFGSVYKADFPNGGGGDSLAVKVMDTSAGSLQGEREFHNELSLSSHLIGSPHIVSLLGFSSDRRGRRLILVYELMANRSLQDALLDRKCEELMDWNKRFEIVTDIAKGIEFLHHSCDPIIIHGDVKPSNILLDSDFKAKIGDFGLARVKSEDLETRILIEEDDKRKDLVVVDDNDNGSILEETESVITVFEEGNVVNLSPENSGISVLTETVVSPGEKSGLSPENSAVSVLTVAVGVASPEMMTSIPSPETCAVSVLTETGLSPGVALSPGSSSKVKVGSKRDWWWKQDNNGGSRGGGVESGSVKDYVMEWIGSEIKKERPNDNKEWINSGGDGGSSSVSKKKKKDKKRKPREWWKEEFCEELTRKKRKKKKKMMKRGLSSISSIDSWFHRDRDDDASSVRDQNLNPTKRKKRNSIDWWVDGLSGELKSAMGKKNSQDSGLWCDVNVQKSGGVSSTPSMRGTVCYIAPECGGGGLVSEKCDVYSFGVLLLVLVSGRRPLQVTASPMSEFERANLISWAKQLACNGKLLDLVDKSIHSLENEQAVLCITIALLCLQRSPVKRPTMKEIVQMLSGASEPPHLPFEFSPSPPMGFPFKSRRKAR
ncbi:PREDICTED: receptor-like serine/threonine-protein kinase At2g45590 [Camelina sativa]|uniref:Receptor-like serine/threonine-protein kinase At2g45590 n=1 Tax=Camelina sativa TaxID=90675 RepID=A0ABM0YZ20_CAMSA|nr:PREDICTED: receptor-like serine/threonine-protein kinase At2g45590 [Camelina sativa]